MLVHKNGWRPHVRDDSRQLIESVARGIACGDLVPGDRLPSVRSLAAELRINPNTAARSIREMESAGLASPRRGVGCVVAAGAREAAQPIAREALLRELDATVDVARGLGLQINEVVASLRERWKENDHAG